MRRIDEGEEERHRDGVDVLLEQGANGGIEAVGIERLDLRTIGPQTPGHFHAPAAGREEAGRPGLQEQPIDVGTVRTPDVEDVAVAGGHQQPDAATPPLQHRIGRHRRAMHEAAHRRRGNTERFLHSPDGVDHRLVGVGPVGRHLEHALELIALKADEVGEGAACVYAYAHVAHAWFREEFTVPPV